MSNIANYEVLATDIISVRDKEKILAEIINVKTPNAKLPENFTFKILDHYGRVVLVTYRGIEALLLFKRMTTKLTTLPLEVAPRAHLKNPDEAWCAIKLMEVYPGLSLGEQIDQLLKTLKEKDAVIKSLQAQTDQAENLATELLSIKRKKSNKAAPPFIPATPLASPEVNKFLAKLKPVKLQTIVRTIFLAGQGFDITLKNTGTAAPFPDIPPKMKKRIFARLAKVDKLFKKSKLEKQLEPYVPQVFKPKSVKPDSKVKKVKTKASVKSIKIIKSNKKSKNKAKPVVKKKKP